MSGRKNFSVLSLNGLFLALGICLTGFAGASRAGLELVSQSVQVSPTDQQATFTLVFNHVPNFATCDSFGRPADSFQVECIPNTKAPMDALNFGDIRAVVRGDEIGKGHMLAIRDGFENGSDPFPASGGWGTIRGKVPFQLTGDTLTFSAGMNLLDAPSGTFSYRAFTTYYGSTVSSVQGSASASVPLPPALPAGLAMLVVFAMVQWMRSHRACPARVPVRR